MANSDTNDTITVPKILSRKASQDIQAKPISAITAYDYTFARLIDNAGVDIILVGDSLASVIQGYENTLPVSLDEMIYHCKCVKRGATRSLVVADLPFLSYQISPEEALRSAGRLIKESGVSAVKLEGGVAFKDTIRKIVDCDIPVMGHVGLTPQSYHRMGGHKLQGREHASEGKSKVSAGTYEKILEDALAAEDAGVFALVVEGVPEELGQKITASVSIPTIGIGAGRYCDGQILVMHDLLGLENRRQPKFVKKYASMAEDVQNAVKSYVAEVQSGAFPGENHVYQASPTNGKKAKSNLRLMQRK